MKKILLLCIAIVLSLTMFSCSGANDKAQIEQEIKNGITMKKLDSFFDDNNMKNGVEFKCVDYSSEPYYFGSESYQTSIIYAKSEDGVLSLSVYSSRSGALLFSISSDTMYISSSDTKYIYDADEAKKEYENLNMNMDNLPLSFTDFFDVTDNDSGLKLKVKSSLLSYINEQCSSFIEDFAITFKVIDDQVTAKITVDYCQKYYLDYTAEEYAVFQGKHKEYSTPVIPDNCFVSNITDSIVKLEKLNKVILAAENSNFLDNKHLRLHFSEGVFGSEKANIEIPIDINYYRKYSNMNATYLIDLSSSYKYFDSSTVDGQQVKNKSIMPYLKDMHDNQPISFQIILDYLYDGTTLEEFNKDVLETAIDKNYDIKILMTEQSSVDQSMLVYSTDKDGNKNIISYATYNEDDNDSSSNIHNLPSFFYDSTDEILSRLNTCIELFGQIDVESKNDNIIIEPNKIVPLLTDRFNASITNLEKTYNITSSADDISLDSLKINIDTKNNIINSLACELLYTSTTYDSTRTAIKLKLENLGAYDKEAYDKNVNLYETLSK